MKLLLIVHRYLGVAVGLLMTLWCLSGFVMMYQGFPELTPEERIVGLEPLRLDGCCDPGRLDLADDLAISDFSVEMAAGSPVLRISEGRGPPAVYDLRTGRYREGFSDPEVLMIAKAYAAGAGLAGAPRDLGPVGKDQWTIQTARPERRAHLIAFDDPARTQLYISAATGEVFQQTTRRERVLSWLGVIPHWLYPTVLRQNGKLWSAVVVWSSVIGTFLTVTGLFVGITRFRRYGGGRWSPYRGWWFWHHVVGLVFGVLTLTWVASGLMTMNPWGLLEGQGRAAVREDYVGPLHGLDLKAFLAAAPAAIRPGVVSLDAAPVGGALRVLATRADGAFVRLDERAAPVPLAEAEVRQALLPLRTPITAFDRIEAEDDYYYGHHDAVVLPAYRIVLGDARQTHIYLDGATGEIARVVDDAGRQTRWIVGGFHSFDFALLRTRPVWDIVVLLLLAGVTVVCGTGAWLSIKRVGRDLTGLKDLTRKVVRLRLPGN